MYSRVGEHKYEGNRHGYYLKVSRHIIKSQHCKRI